jgi:hypothetical protein
MIWYMVAFICALSAFANAMREGHSFMAGTMIVSAGVCIFGILTS